MCTTTTVSWLTGTVIRVTSIIQCGHRCGPVAPRPFVYHPVVVIITYATTVTTVAPFTTAARHMRIITLMVRIDRAAGLADDAERGLAGRAAGELIG